MRSAWRGLTTIAVLASGLAACSSDNLADVLREARSRTSPAVDMLA